MRRRIRHMKQIGYSRHSRLTRLFRRPVKPFANGDIVELSFTDGSYDMVVVVSEQFPKRQCDRCVYDDDMCCGWDDCDYAHCIFGAGAHAEKVSNVMEDL
jgi:hypothetical protein